MKLRLTSGVCIVSLFTVMILYTHILFITMIIAIAVIMLCEWYAITRISILDTIIGFVFIPIAVFALIKIHYISKTLLMLYFIAIWSVDSFAMIGGKLLKGPKLAPYLSPNKTWSGSIIGTISCVMITMLIAYYTNNSYNNIIYCVVYVAVFAQFSDLFVSRIKRKFNIKDSGNIIPGHGGMLDRFDSIILTAPGVMMYAIYYKIY